MKLKIHNVSESDFGTYRCLAKNSQGETTGDIELYGNSNITGCPMSSNFVYDKA